MTLRTFARAAGNEALSSPLSLNWIGCKAAANTAICYHTEKKAERWEAELNEKERGRALAWMQPSPKLTSPLGFSAA